MRHPMQPIVMAEDKVVRFQPNKIIKWLLDTGKIDLNLIAIAAAEYRAFDNDDQMQLAMLIGYSVSGFGDLDYADPAVVSEADAIAEKIVAQAGMTTSDGYLYAYVKAGRKAFPPHLSEVFRDWEESDHQRGDFVEHVTFRKPMASATADDRQLARDYAEPFTHDPE